MDLGIAGKRAVITGGSSGLGLAVAEALAAEGADLILFARDPGRLAAAETRLKQFPISVETVAGDMTSKEDVLHLADFVATRGGPDILVLNTGRPPSPMRDFLDETDDDRWQDGYRVQLLGGIRVLQAITPMMLTKGWGRIVAITSASVKQPMPLHAISTTFRAGLTAALRHLANETADKGITVNAVCPASVMTDNFARNHDVAARARNVPMGRLGTAEELAGTVVFLASKQAGFITGASIQVDGGMTGALF